MTTIAEIASKHNLKLIPHDGGARYMGANPYEPGATEDGFHLFPLGALLDGLDKGGCAWQRTPPRFYNSREVAKLEGIEYADYEGSLNDPKMRDGKGFIVPEMSFDTRSLEERGLTKEAQLNWEISAPRGANSSWGERRLWPTFHPNGATARSRIKFRYPGKQLELPDRKNQKPAKTMWDNNTKDLGMPVAYGVNLITPGSQVWLVNSELAVWLFWQEGLTAICPLGEGRSDKTYREMMRLICEQGAGELCVLLDNDLGGRNGSVRASNAAKMEKLPCIVYDVSTAPKVGFDASDLWQFWHKAYLDEYEEGETGPLIDIDFAKFLGSQAVADPNVLLGWEKATQRLDAAAEVEAANKVGTRLADEIEKGRKREDGEDKAGDAEKLLKMLSGHQMFHTEAGASFIVVDFADGRRTIFDINSGSFAQWVRFIYNRDTGKVAKDTAVKAAIATLSANALYLCDEMKTYTRIAALNGNYYLDLCNKAAEVVEITAEGWRITKDCPVFFQRPLGMQEIPSPVRHATDSNFETWAKFKRNINHGDDRNWVLIVAWMVSALVPGRWPCPILSVNGEQGSAKSWLTRLIRQTVDPNDGFMVQTIKEEKDVVVIAEKMRVVALDNQSSLPPWLSDLLSAMVTGTPYVCRSLFTNDDHKIYKGQPAIILNGIPDKIGGSDFNNRALKLFIPKLVDKGYREEADVIEDWEKIRPQLLCAILDAMVCGLKNMPRKVEIKAGRILPRMADFATWAMCCEEALPFDIDSIYNAYSQNIVDTAGADLENFFPAIIMEFAALTGGFSGSASELYDGLHNQAVAHLMEREVDESSTFTMSEAEKANFLRRVRERVETGLSKTKGWPTSTAAMGTMLTRVAPALRANAGIDCSRGVRSALGIPWRLQVATGTSPLAARKAVAEMEEETLNFDGVDPFEDSTYGVD